MSICYVMIPGAQPGRRVGLVRLNEDGYYDLKGHDFNLLGGTPRTDEEVQKQVDALNESLGVPKHVAQSMCDGSMFGWHTPAAAVAIGYWKGREEAKA